MGQEKAKTKKCDICGIPICAACRSHCFHKPPVDIWQNHADLKHGRKVMGCGCNHAPKRGRW